MVRRLAVLALFALLMPPGAARAGSKLAGVATVDLNPGNFRAQLAAHRDDKGEFREGTLFRLAPGNYRLSASLYTDSLCGNCENPATPATATLGLRVAGQGIVFEGTDPAATVIHTNAGYGLLFEDCEDCVLRGVTLTDGVRDPDPNATDAAIVARRSTLRIEDCVIGPNLGDSTAIATNVVGVIGIAGREGAQLEILGNRILRNSWDGIALYRGASARIEDNVIDGVDKAGGRVAGGGRGVGIGLTWNATASIRRNRVTRYWKGIGVFVNAKALIEENVVEDVLTWGIALWDAGRGRPQARIRRNVIFETGACGISLTRETGGEAEPGDCAENVLARTGSDARYDDPQRYCAQCPVSVQALPEGFVLGENWGWENRRAVEGVEEQDRGGADLSTEAFADATRSLMTLLRAHPALAGARCFRELPGPLGAGKN
ncbi:right-handed parallel beta-helix repeat-containing protein [bacterium]|nr:right-handed parallel beta-helix repeat-containing protein [bacterium]